MKTQKLGGFLETNSVFLENSLQKVQALMATLYDSITFNISNQH